MNEKGLLCDGTYLLRAPEPEDLDILFNMENDTALWMVSGNAVPYSRYQIKRYIQQSQHDFYTDRQVRFMIVRQADGVVLGSVDLTDIDPYNGRAEIGIALLSEYRGQGIASASLKIVAGYAKSVLRLRQLFCLVPNDNEESIKLFASNGFNKSGQLKDWLVKDDSGKLVKDEKVWDEKLWEFLDRLAYNTNTIGMDRQFNSTLRGLITVSGGDYGYMVNQVTEHDKLVKDFKKQKKETREPDYYITPYNDQTENDGIGNTYIEADLSAQHIWCYVDGQLVVEGDCVSGDTTTGHGTPTGVFGIMFMLRDTTLRGVMQSNGKYEYETKVGYWMPFYDGCGFHDAWWRSAFGGTIYQGNGSHGCINLPVDVAEQLYSYCDDKMPVVVYW